MTNSLDFPALVSGSKDARTFSPLGVRNPQTPKIGAKIKVNSDLKATNNLIIKVLGQGCNALWLDIPKDSASISALTDLLSGVELTMIDCFFQVTPSHRDSLYALLEDFLPLRDEDASGCCYIFHAAPGQKHAYLIEQGKDIVGQICEALHFIHAILQDGPCGSHCVAPIFVPFTDHFFQNVSKVRALRIVAELLQSAYKDQVLDLQFHSYGDPTTSEYPELISIAHKHLAAYATQNDSVFMGPWISNRNDLSLALLAIRSGSIIEYETDLLASPDPAAGSYYFEKSSEILAKQAWADFKDSLP